MNPIMSTEGSEESIRQILQAQTAAWSNADAIAWTKYFTNEASFINLRGDVLQGRGAIEARIAASLQGGLKGTSMSLTLRQLTSLTPDIALVEADCEYSGIQNGLPGLPTPNGILQTRLSYVAMKEHRHWSFVAGQNTVILQ